MMNELQQIEQDKIENNRRIDNLKIGDLILFGSLNKEGDSVWRQRVLEIENKEIVLSIPWMVCKNDRPFGHWYIVEEKENNDIYEKLSRNKLKDSGKKIEFNG